MFSKGVKRIDSVIAKFNSVKEDLLTGIAEVESEIELNDEAIENLKSQNVELANSKKIALKVATKIDALLE